VNYEIKIKYEPQALTISEACILSNREHPQIHIAIQMDKLDYGYSFEEYGLRGQKLVIINSKWIKWLNKRRRLDMLKDENSYKYKNDTGSNNSERGMQEV